jgi:hypothetical protein
MSSFFGLAAGFNEDEQPVRPLGESRRAVEVDELGEVGQLPSVQTLAKADGFELGAYEPENLRPDPLGIRVAVAVSSTPPVVRVVQGWTAPPEEVVWQWILGWVGNDLG